MSTSNVDAHNATPLLEHVDGLLSPFTTRQYSHLPTPQSPNTLGRYINEQPPSPETPVPHNASSSITPASSDKQRYEPWKLVFGDKSTRLESVTSQYATPESSPHFQPITCLPHSNPAVPRYPFHAIGFSTPKQSLSLPLEMDTPLRAPSPLGSPSSHSPALSSPFIGKMSLDSSTVDQSGLPLPATELDDVFSVPKLYHHATAVKNTLSTPPVSPPRDPGPIQAGGEMERIRQSVMEDTRNHIQEVESRRPDYLKRAKRALSETDPSYFAEDPNEREHWPPIGVMDSPQKGRRLKLFQETSDESFEESLMAGGYGRYRTTDWVRQPQPISLRSTIGSSSVVVSLLEKVEEAPTTEKEQKKQKRLAAFSTVLQSGSSKVCPVELEGKGRVLMEVASLESVTTRSPEPSPSKRKGNSRRKRQPIASSADKKTRQTDSQEARLEKPNWPDTEFPWRLRTEERNEEVKAAQEERLRWIERYLDRDSDEDDDQVTPHDSQHQHDCAFVYDRDSRTSYQVKMGRGKMIPLSVAPDDPWNLIPKRSFLLDPADAREALLAKKRVRTLSYRQQKRKRQDEDDEDEVLCVCRGGDDGRQLVQCDSCQMWYHLECIGIKNIASLGREEDPWFCGNCRARSRSPSTEIDEAPSSEPTFVPTDPLPFSRRSSDATFFQPNVPESPNWSSSRMPRTPTRIRNSLDTFRPPWNWTDPSRPIPSTPRQHHSVAKIYNTPGPLDGHCSNPYDDSPFDPASTPSRGIKFHVPFATPKATAWRPNPMPQTPSRNRGGTNKHHVPHSASLDDSSLSGGSAIQYSFARVLPSDESPIRRNRSSDATFGRRRFLSPVRPNA